MYLYIGPIKIGVKLEFRDGLLSLVDKEDDVVLGYLNIFGGHCFISYELYKLPSILAALYRNDKLRRKWSSYLIDYKGNQWRGSLIYDNGKNMILSYMTRDS